MCALRFNTIHLSLIRFTTRPGHVNFRLHGNSPDLRKIIFYTGGSPESE